MSFLGRSLASLLSEGAVGNEVFEFFMKRIRTYDDKIHAFVPGGIADIFSAAKTGVLCGLPLALKDNIVTTNLPTTASSKILEGYISPYDATVVTGLQTAGASFLGKTNLDAWAHGSSTEASDFGPTSNPYNLERVPGGSSGGSAAAVAAGLAPAAIGTETAGSIRLPAAWCGVVGLKPTYGRVSRYGIIAMGSSWDCPGPITQTVEDAALLLEVIAGQDPKDATSMSIPVEKWSKLLKTEKKLTIGYADEYFKDVDPEIMASVENAMHALEDRGHTLKKITMLDPKYAISVYMILQRAEVSSNLARYTGVRYGMNRTAFGKEAKKRIILGAFVLSSGYVDEYYKKAAKVRYLLAQDFKKAFEDVDVILAPTTPVTATRIGDADAYAFFGEMMDVLTEPAAAAGIPAISIPAGLSEAGLPIGVQLMGKHFDETTVLQIAYQLEQDLAFDRQAIFEKYA